MQNPNTSAIPLMDVLLPAFSPCQSVLLVADSAQSDGRFVLHTIVTHVLSKTSTAQSSSSSSFADDNNNKNNNNSSTSSVLWLAAGPYTPQLVANALKKMGCNTTTKKNDDQKQHEQRCHERLCIRSIPVELGERLLLQNNNNIKQQDNDDDDLDLEFFTKQLYKEIKDWILLKQQQARPSLLIVLDDVSALAALLGTRLTYGLIRSLQAYQRHWQQQQQQQHSPFGILLRCSQDKEQQQQQLQQQQLSKNTTTFSTDWIGAGGAHGSVNNEIMHDNNNEAFGPSWESSLIELVDWLLDVVPLTSGYTREAHGRLILSRTSLAVAGYNTTTRSSFTETSSSVVGKSSDSSKKNMSIYNYCLTENKALAIRVQSITS